MPTYPPISSRIIAQLLIFQPTTTFASATSSQVTCSTRLRATHGVFLAGKFTTLSIRAVANRLHKVRGKKSKLGSWLLQFKSKSHETLRHPTAQPSSLPHHRYSSRG